MTGLVAPAYHDLSLAWRAAFAPPARMRVADWAEANLMLPAESNAEPGPLRLTAAQRGVLDSTEEPGVHTVVLMGASQSGKSLVIDARTAWEIAQAPGPALVVHPTQAKAEDWTTGRLDPIIRSSPALRSLIGSTRAYGGDSATGKDFPGGRLVVASAHKPDDLAARAIKYLRLDEIDRFPQSAGREGSPVKLATKRLETYIGRGALAIIASTPVRAKDSAILAQYLRGDQRKFHTTWPCCGCVGVIQFNHVKWPKGNPAAAHLECPDCRTHHNEVARRRMLDGGEWQPTAEAMDSGVVSFHWSALISHFTTLGRIAQQSEDAVTPADKRVFVNTVLAEPYDDADEETSLEAVTLQDRATSIRSPYSSDITIIAAGVDVQPDRVELTYLACKGANGFAVLDHVVLPGDTTAPVNFRSDTETVWHKLDGALAVTFPLDNGQTLQLAIAGVDSGFNTQNVAEFVAYQRQHRKRRVLALKGTSGFDKPYLREGSKLRALTQLFLIGVDVVKRDAQRMLNLTSGPNAIALPDHLEGNYFDGLAAEKLVTKYVRGYAKPEWHRIVKRNEPLDCLTYALAMITLAQKTPGATKRATKTPRAQTSIADIAARLNSHNRT